MLRLTGNEKAVAEIAATAEHITALTAAAAAFQLGPEFSAVPTDQPLATVALLDESSAPDAADTLREIEQWSEQALGVRTVPAVWRALANHPGLLQATWSKNRLILGLGVLDELTKNCAALAVAHFRQNAYWISYQTRILRHSFGFDDRAIVETTGMVMHALAFNTIAHGMRLDPPYSELSLADFEPGGRLEQGGPGGQSR